MAHTTVSIAKLAVGFLAIAPVVSTATPDEILLRGGGRVSGVIVERTATTVAIETGPGRVTLPMSRVESIVESGSFLAEFQQRASQLDARDAVGWAALARWATDRDLLTQAGDAWRHVISLDPNHPEANTALGRVQVGGAWMEAVDGYRARGLVPFEGRWVTPEEHEAAMRERAFEEASARQEREADLRVREAEARAREAEARALEAEAATDASYEDGGIPLWWAVGGPALGTPFDGRRQSVHGQGGHTGERSEGHGRRTEGAPQPTPRPTPTPAPAPASSAAKKSAPYRTAPVPKAK
jgi:hypothetical protein